jgi:adenosine deaminase
MQGMRRVALIALLAVLVPSGLADEPAAIRAFERAKATDPELIVFLRSMPKGGDLHNHVTGAVFSDFLLDHQVRSGRRFDPATNQFTDDPAKPLASTLLTNNDLLYAWLNVVSMRGWQGLGVTGHDHFFNTFAYLGSAMQGLSSAQILHEVVDRARWQNIHYLELMTDTAPRSALDAYYASLPDSTDLKVALEALRPRLAVLQAASRTYIDGRDARLAELLELSAPVTSTQNPIVVRYMWSCNRNSSLDQFFAQAAAGLWLAATDPRIVALNIVAPEDHPNARNNFERQMEMLEFLWAEFGRPNITLHAGELTLPISPVEPMRDRIRKSIEIGKARRIGHGISIAWEDDVEDLLAKMRREGIAVEICLSSNHAILGIDREKHPLKLYREAGVPVFLNTDDEGVSRGNLTIEHLRAVREQGLGYLELKEMARNSIEYSFLAGESLYVDRDFSRLHSAFATVRHDDWQPSREAEHLMRENEKLQVQVRLERSFVQFERRFR